MCPSRDTSGKGFRLKPLPFQVGLGMTPGAVLLASGAPDGASGACGLPRGKAAGYVFLEFA